MASEREGKLAEALGWFVQFHSGHVLPPELGRAMTSARAALALPKEEAGACRHGRGSKTEAEGYWVHRCLDCGAVNFNNEGWQGGRT